MSNPEEDLIIELGSQVAILDAAAESAEKAPDQLDGRYSKSVAESIRQMMDGFLKPSPNPKKKPN